MSTYRRYRSWRCRDLTLNNLMLDASNLFPFGFHPVYTNRDLTFHQYAKYITRTECWPRYYIIDLGMSRRYSKRKAPCEKSTPFSLPFVHLLPERKGTVSRLFNPFPVDVFHLGHILRKEFHVVRCISTPTRLDSYLRSTNIDRLPSFAR